MPGQKLYPRATVRKIVKAHSNCNVSKNADVMVWYIFPRSQNVADQSDMLFLIDVLGLHALHADVRLQTSRMA